MGRKKRLCAELFLIGDVFEHRIILNSKAKLSEVTAASVIADIIKKVPAPGISEKQV